MRRLYLTIVVLAVTQVVMPQVPVVLVAGQSNTDGRVDNVELPAYIKRDGYRYCQWSFGSGVHSGEGRFEPFTPRNYSQKPERWAYDAVVYYELERLWQRPFYVIKESLGGTAIDPRCESNSNMHWSADPDYLASTAASDKGGLSLLKAFIGNIGACIDNQLSKLPEGYDIKFMLWHQGESDRSQADSYHDNLKAVVDYVRTYLVNKTGQQKYARLPFICGTFSKASKQGSPKVAAALYQLQQEDPNFHVVDVSDATLGRDQIHFDAAGAELLGKRMFEKLSKLGLLADSRVDYVLSWKGDGIGVSLTVDTPKDTMRLSYGSDAGGQTDQMTWLQDLQVAHGKLMVDSMERALTVIPDGGKAKLSYVVRCTLPKDYGSPGGCIMDLFRPDIDDKMLFSRTENIFVTPTDSIDVPVSVTWDSVPDYPVFCLYNAGHGTERYEGTSSELSWSVMVGDPLLSIDTLYVDRCLHYIVTALRQHPEQNKRALKTYFKTFYKSVSAFWEEPYMTPYSMVFFPFRRNTFEMTGNGFSNGFVSRYDATADTILTGARRDLFTHEIGHKWLNNGPVWFSEGFNEMQTGYQLVASGLTEASYFATYFNIALSGLYHSPYRNVSDEVAEESFWKDNDYTWLLYWRGFCYAFHLAGLVEKATGEPNAWRLMMAAVKPFINDFTPEKFLKAMSRIVDWDRLEADYRKYILEGQDIDFRPDELPSGCRIVRQEDGTPRLSITDMTLFCRHFK